MAAYGTLTMLDITHIPANQPLKVIIGAGEQSYPGWIATHREQLDLLNRDGWVSSFFDRRVDAFLCEHVWEHLTEVEGRAAAALCYEFLQPGGYLRCAVPDANYPDPEYQRLARGDVPPGHPAADHKIVYDYHLFVDIFEEELSLRQIVSDRYKEGLSELNDIIKIPFIKEDNTSAWALYSILSSKREELMDTLSKEKIPCAIYYPKPLHLQKAFSHLNYGTNSLPVSEDVSRKILSLPMHPYLEKEDQDKIIEVIKSI